MTKLILDTNILLLDAHNLTALADEVYLPETVLDEIDSKKSGTSEIAFQAREFSRLLTKAERVNYTTHNKKLREGNLTIVELALGNTAIHIVSFDNYPTFKDTELNIKNDRKILLVAQLLNEGTRIPFMSNDVMCRIRAESLMLQTVDLKTSEDKPIVFTKHFEVTTKQLGTLHNTHILDVDKEYVQENYNYIFTDGAQQKLATISNGFIQILGKDTEKDLRSQEINPINSGQLFFSKAIQDLTIDIVVCDSAAGSGKTLSAVSNAIRLVRQSKFDSLIYIRASVDDVDNAEAIGFLSGNQEKVEVYLHPLEDVLDTIARNRLKHKKIQQEDFENKVQSEIDKIRATCNIQEMIGLGMRGRTFKRAIVIIDEVQNQSKASLQKMLTRFDNDCKVILIGSNRQIDNYHINKYTNGLSAILDACRSKYDNIKLHGVLLPKIVRGKIPEFAENLFSS